MTDTQAMEHGRNAPTRGEDRDMTRLVYGDYVAVIADTPAASLFALAQEGFVHYLGNRVASAVAGEKKRRAEKKDANGNPAPEPEMTEDEVLAFADTKRKEWLQKIAAGTLGVRTASAPKATKLETVMAQIARERIDAAIAAAKASGKTVEVSKEKRAEMVKALVAKDAGIRAEAERRMASVKAVDDLDLASLLEGDETQDEPQDD